MKKFIYLLMVLFAVNGALMAQVAVVANKSVKVDKLELSEVDNIFSQKVLKWTDGQKIVLIDQSADSEAKTKFYNVLGKEQSALKKIWLRKQLTGEASAPQNAGSDSEVISKVSSTPGAIGYVSESSVNDNVKVVLIIK
ncbi:MAG: substrate-binding domain-containing protein [Melioribacter sp.]|uniref:substrate-binding domain-containing protein n=1 Tax=Melioribacter sp. TaxID=2052167 RepID=UPI003BE649A8